MTLCEQCGYNASPEARYCIMCGARLNASQKHGNGLFGNLKNLLQGSVGEDELKAWEPEIKSWLFYQPFSSGDDLPVGGIRDVQHPTSPPVTIRLQSLRWTERTDLDPDGSRMIFTVKKKIDRVISVFLLDRNPRSLPEFQGLACFHQAIPVNVLDLVIIGRWNLHVPDISMDRYYYRFNHGCGRRFNDAEIRSHA